MESYPNSEEFLYTELSRDSWLPQKQLVIPVLEIAVGLNRTVGNALAYSQGAESEFKSNRRTNAHALILLAIDELGKFYYLLDRYRTACNSGKKTVVLPDFYNHEPKIQRMLQYHSRVTQTAGYEILKGAAKQLNLKVSKVYDTLDSRSYRRFLDLISADPKGYREASMYIDFRKGWTRLHLPPRHHLIAAIKMVKGDAMSYKMLLDQNGADYLRDATWLS